MSVEESTLEIPETSSLSPITKEELIHLYSEMLIIRRVEELAAKAYTMRKILGFCHLYIGQESVAVGTASVTKDDYWISAYREHGHAIAKGVPANEVMAELFGKATGTSQGLGGSMHIFSKEKGFYGGHGIVGGQIPLGAGMAFGDKYNETGAVTLCYFGDGAARQSVVCRIHYRRGVCLQRQRPEPSQHGRLPGLCHRHRVPQRQRRARPRWRQSRQERLRI